jgi:hypothetical protein
MNWIILILSIFIWWNTQKSYPEETDIKTPTLRQGDTHARVGANHTENDLQDKWDWQAQQGEHVGNFSDKYGEI